MATVCALRIYRIKSPNRVFVPPLSFGGNPNASAMQQNSVSMYVEPLLGLLGVCEVYSVVYALDLLLDLVGFLDLALPSLF